MAQNLANRAAKKKKKEWLECTNFQAELMTCQTGLSALRYLRSPNNTSHIENESVTVNI